MTVSDIKTRLHNGIDRLSDAQLQKLYAIFLSSFPEKKKPVSSRELGRFPGLIQYMSPDFDEPLEDFNEYMPE